MHLSISRFFIEQSELVIDAESYWLRIANLDNNISRLAILMQSGDLKHFFLPSLLSACDDLR
jgi:hypothetical protein